MKPRIRLYSLVLTATVCHLGMAWLHAQAPFGQWDFNTGDLSATVGQPLTYIDGVGGLTDQRDAFGTTTALGIPDIGGTAANVMRFPASTNSSEGYNMPTPAGNGGGGLVNEWTVIMDLLYTGASDRTLRGLMDLDGGLISADAEFFINANNQLGVGSFYGSIVSNSWHRIGIVVQASSNRMYFYIDGIRVGSRDAGGAQALDGRWALAASGIAALFNDDNGGAASGYVNSIQLRNVALNQGQMGALGGPQAAGIPQVIPPVRAYLEQFYPFGGFARTNSKVGFVVNRGDSVISNVVFRLNGQVITPSLITTNGLSITYEISNPTFPRQSDQTAVLSFNDSLAGSQSFTNQFRVPVFFEDFDLLTLGPSVDPALGGEPNSPPTATNVWTTNAPVGWIVDNSRMPPQTDPPSGRPEWEGWTFADVLWWGSPAVDTQLRETFTKARGAAAIADPDEWDDYNNPDGTRGYFHSFLSTPAISLDGIAPNTAFLRFDSSWRPEGFDDPGPDGMSTNNQTATVKISYNGGPAVQLLKWDSEAGSPTFHGDNPNETVSLPINNPAGATSAVITFGMTDAANDWWWAVDSIVVDAGAIPPAVTQPPADLIVTEDDPASFSVAVSGTAPLSYQWYKGQGANRTAISGATTATNRIAQTYPGDAGFYSVVVNNAAGSATSIVARLVVLPRYGVTNLLTENFNGLALGPNVDEALAGANVWTKTPPPGWTIDDSGVPGAGTANDGVTEWAGWSFADRVWWATTAGDQQRSLFTKGTGAVAVADGDEWDDQPREPGLMNTFLKTVAIPLQGIKPNSVILKFDSSWRAETDQKAVITASFNGQAAVEIMRWQSDPAVANYHGDGVNETVTIPVNNPAGATNVVLSFGYIDAGNNWWWAVDNIVVSGARYPMFYEDFETLVLGPNVEEGIVTGSGGAKSNVWTKTGPAGWTIDDTGVPGVGTAQDGVTEWAGWSFADRVWWAATAGDQQRTGFTRSTGAAAIADSDEWDDIAHAAGNMATYLTTTPINITGQAANSLLLRFYSSWRAEDPQKVNIRVSYDGGAPVEVLRWESSGASLHADNVNETVNVSLNNPAGAASMRITFGYFDTRNNWWWAIDNIEVIGGVAAPPNLGALIIVRAGNNVNLTWTAGATVRLQKTTSLSPTSWTDVAGTVGGNSASEPIGTGNTYYRLFQP